jgi:tRNA A37 threonylcarbamoyltransferase TsaD
VNQGAVSDGREEQATHKNSRQGDVHSRAMASIAPTLSPGTFQARLRVGAMLAIALASALDKLT